MSLKRFKFYLWSQNQISIIMKKMTPPQQAKKPTTLLDLPPELLGAIISELPSASSVASLERTSKSLNAFVNKFGWETFARTRFPSLCPIDISSYKDASRTLTTFSRAWDRRAFVARYTEPWGDITAYPGPRKVDKWKRPKGQTVGFTPQLDVREIFGRTWHEREETLAFSAGAEVCIKHSCVDAVKKKVWWTTYRPHSAIEGRDDVTALHIVELEQNRGGTETNVVSGTANGDLRLLRLPKHSFSAHDVSITYFTTQGLPVRSSSLYDRRSGQPPLLAAGLGDVRLALYTIDPTKTKVGPIGQIEIQPHLRADGSVSRHHRIWSTNFLSFRTLAIGLGLSEHPIHTYSITESGVCQAPLRRFRLLNAMESTEGSKMGNRSAVHSTLVLPANNGSRGDGDVFLSGAYDGIVRLHDMRSSRDVEQSYIDPTDDSAVYSILARGHERLMAGTSRHNLLKIFDLRLGAKCYSFLDACTSGLANDYRSPDSDYNIFLRPNTQSSAVRGGNWRQGRNRSAESSVYTLASPSLTSPYVYAGVENAIYSLAFTEILDLNPDPRFGQWSATSELTATSASSQVSQSKDILNLATYDPNGNMKLHVQRSLLDTWRTHALSKGADQPKLDQRWQGADELNL